MMKTVKYPLILAGVLVAEMILAYLLYVFVTLAKPVYVAFSVILMIAGILYLGVSRYREKIKIKPKKDVLNGMMRIALTVISVILLFLAGVVIIRAVFYLVRGA